MRLFYFHLPCSDTPYYFSLTLLCPYFSAHLTLRCLYSAATRKTFSAPCALLTARIASPPAAAPTWCTCDHGACRNDHNVQAGVVRPSVINSEFTSISTDSLENYSETGVTENSELAQATTSQIAHSNQFNITASASGGCGFVSGSASTTFDSQNQNSQSAVG